MYDLGGFGAFLESCMWFGLIAVLLALLIGVPYLIWWLFTHIAITW